MTRFLAGFGCGVLAVLWWLGRPSGRPLHVRLEEEWRVPVDPYVDGLPW